MKLTSNSRTLLAVIFAFASWGCQKSDGRYTNRRTVADSHSELPSQNDGTSGLGFVGSTVDTEDEEDSNISSELDVLPDKTDPILVNQSESDRSAEIEWQYPVRSDIRFFVVERQRFDSQLNQIESVKHNFKACTPTSTLTGYCSVKDDGTIGYHINDRLYQKLTTKGWERKLNFPQTEFGEPIEPGLSFRYRLRVYLTNESSSWRYTPLRGVLDAPTLVINQLGGEESNRVRLSVTNNSKATNQLRIFQAVDGSSPSFLRDIEAGFQNTQTLEMDLERGHTYQFFAVTAKDKLLSLASDSLGSRVKVRALNNILPAFPEAEGFGATVTGGRGGSVYHVTKLDDLAPRDCAEQLTICRGTLRYGIEFLEGARTIVFDLAGVIVLKEQLTITNGNLTIAGETAPGTGITITLDQHQNIPGAVMAASYTSNIILRGLTFRRGNSASTDYLQKTYDINRSVCAHRLLNSPIVENKVLNCLNLAYWRAPSTVVTLNEHSLDPYFYACNNRAIRDQLPLPCDDALHPLEVVDFPETIVLDFDPRSLHQINGDALSIFNSKDIIVDGCTLGWANDEVLGINYSNGESNVENITVQNSIIADAFGEPRAPRHPVVTDMGEGSYSLNLVETPLYYPLTHPLGMLAGGADSEKVRNISLIRNLFANNRHRNPRLSNANGEVVNNFVYRWSSRAGSFAPGGRFDILDNVFDPRVKSTIDRPILKMDAIELPEHSFYVDGNFVAQTREFALGDVQCPYAYGQQVSGMGMKCISDHAPHLKGIELFGDPELKDVNCSGEGDWFEKGPHCLPENTFAAQNVNHAPIPPRRAAATRAGWIAAQRDLVGNGTRIDCTGRKTVSRDVFDQVLLSYVEGRGARDSSYSYPAQYPRTVAELVEFYGIARSSISTGSNLNEATSAIVTAIASANQRCDDIDQDGLPDAWESQFTIDLNACSDVDGDGYTNLEEFLNNTSPTVRDGEYQVPAVIEASCPITYAESIPDQFLSDDDIINEGDEEDDEDETVPGIGDVPPGEELCVGRADYIQVRTISDLRAVSSGLKYCLLNNIDLGGTNWEPIPYATGMTLNGNGKAIRNLSINRPNSDNAGLFSVLASSHISNLKLQNVSINAFYEVGALVGKINDGNSTVGNVLVQGVITGRGVSIGGLIGKSVGAEISKIKFSGENSGGTVYIGGIVGDAERTTFEDVEVIGKVSGFSSLVGGIVGYSRPGGLIKGAHMIGDVEGSDSIGGIVGRAASTRIADSAFVGSVSGRTDVGGIAGHLRNSSSNRVSFNGDVKASQFVVGGIVGYMYQSVLHSGLAAGAVEAADRQAGGLVGYSNDSEVQYSLSLARTSCQAISQSSCRMLIGVRASSTFARNNFFASELGSDPSFADAGKSITQLQNPDTFSNWLASSIIRDAVSGLNSWIIQTGSTPILRNIPSESQFSQ